MRVFWIGWTQGNGHSVAPATPFTCERERDCVFDDKSAWPAGHSARNTWETIDGKVQ